MSFELCRPDQSRYLAHFTKCNSRGGKSSAKDIFKKILSDKTIKAHSVPWTKGPAVCFTECPWTSMTNHANNYSPYGIGFTKKYIYERVIITRREHHPFRGLRIGAHAVCVSRVSR